jgi:hypothetical protein
VVHDDDIEEIKNRRLCFGCVAEDFLKHEIKKRGVRAKCSYCQRMRKTFSMSEMSKRIEKAFDEHYLRTYDQPTALQYAMLADKECDYYWDRDGDEVVSAIMNAAEISEKAASDIQNILCEKFSDFESAKMGDETEFSNGSYYKVKDTDDSSWQMEWTKLEQSIKSQARFFNHPAAQHLATIFDGLDTMKTQDERSMIVDAGPGTSLAALYRARVFQSDDSLEAALSRSDQHIGPPPPVHASAGRMNAKGISVFYGANDSTVALAEVRPPVGSQVVVARFVIIRPIRLLDLTALGDVITNGSIFDPVFNHQLGRAMFLRSLSERMTKPVMPDNEAFDYLATQAIADFLANEPAINIDGIIFPSVQVAGKALNIVLFNKAAKVVKAELPTGTEVSVSLSISTEEGPEPYYCITELVPCAEENLCSSTLTSEIEHYDFDALNIVDSNEIYDTRKETLKIDLKSLKVHIVNEVAFKTSDHSVTHHRWNKQKSEF